MFLNGPKVKKNSNQCKMCRKAGYYFVLIGSVAKT